MDTEKRIEELEQRVLKLEKMLEEKEQSKTVKEFKHSTYETQLLKKQKKKSFTFENIEKKYWKNYWNYCCLFDFVRNIFSCNCNGISYYKSSNYVSY